MEYTQKHFATALTLSFEETDLLFRIKDNNSEVDFEIDYGNIPYRKRIYHERNNWLRNVGLIWTGLGLIGFVAASLGTSFLSGGFWLLIGLVCLGFYRLLWASYTIFDTEEGSIFVLHDKQHEEIVGKLLDRRKERMLQWFHSTDYGDDSSAELRAIEWLIKQKVLTRGEADLKIAEIETNSETVALISDGPSNKNLH